MKKVYLLSALFFASGVFIANAQKAIQGFIPVNAPAKVAATDKATGTYWIDYSEYDKQYPGNSINYVGFISDGTFTYAHNNRDTLLGSFAAVYEKFDSMVVTSDYTFFQEYPNNSVISVNIDSIFVYVLHENNSNQNDSLTISILGLDAQRRPNNSNVLWDTLIVTNTSLAPNGDVLGFAPNLLRNGSNWGYSIKVQYNDPSLVDTFAVVFANYQNCGYPQVYPAAYYQINLDAGSSNSQIIPLTNGTVVWYQDCNGNSAPDMPDENSFKNWAIWSLVTLTENLGIEEQEEKGLHVVSYPNPAKDVFQIKYDLQHAGEVMLTITDISGKVQIVKNLGNHTNGSYNTAVDVTGFTAGIYFYTIQVDQVKITRRFVVTK
jgi:hypothetical protein